MGVTLNGIGQGYITDRVVELLRAGGIEHALVDMGKTRAIGGHPAGGPWSVGLEDPRAPGVDRRAHSARRSRSRDRGRLRHIVRRGRPLQPHLRAVERPHQLALACPSRSRRRPRPSRTRCRTPSPSCRRRRRRRSCAPAASSRISCARTVPGWCSGNSRVGDVAITDAPRRAAAIPQIGDVDGLRALLRAADTHWAAKLRFYRVAARRPNQDQPIGEAD